MGHQLGDRVSIGVVGRERGANAIRHATLVGIQRRSLEYDPGR